MSWCRLFLINLSETWKDAAILPLIRLAYLSIHKNMYAIHIPISQLSNGSTVEHPHFGHMHTYLSPGLSIHVPPFLHGISRSQNFHSVQEKNVTTSQWCYNLYKSILYDHIQMLYVWNVRNYKGKHDKSTSFTLFSTILIVCTAFII